jgi:hypothetical protein
MKEKSYISMNSRVDKLKELESKRPYQRKAYVNRHIKASCILC